MSESNTKNGAPRDARPNPRAEPQDRTRAQQQQEAETEMADDRDDDGPVSGAAQSTPTDPLAEAQAEAQRMKDQWMRCAADFDNFRKRSRRELEDTRKAGREELLKELLPVFDNLERAMTSAERATDVKPVAEGLKMVLRQFADTIGRFGIAKVATIGSRFDPNIHEAIQQVETNEHPPGTVVAEVQPGYTQGDRLVRAAMVVVAKPKAGAAAADDAGPNGETEEEA